MNGTQDKPRRPWWDMGRAEQPLSEHPANAYEYRAVVSDKGDLTGDTAGPFATEDEAIVARKDLLDAEPPYDDGWIERRICTDWERVDV